MPEEILRAILEQAGMEPDVVLAEEVTSSPGPCFA
jgi:hypothetical protein